MKIILTYDYTADKTRVRYDDTYKCMDNYLNHTQRLDFLRDSLHILEMEYNKQYDACEGH